MKVGVFLLYWPSAKVRRTAAAAVAEREGESGKAKVVRRKRKARAPLHIISARS